MSALNFCLQKQQQLWGGHQLKVQLAEVHKLKS